MRRQRGERRKQRGVRWSEALRECCKENRQDTHASGRREAVEASVNRADSGLDKVQFGQPPKVGTVEGNGGKTAAGGDLQASRRGERDVGAPQGQVPRQRLRRRDSGSSWGEDFQSWLRRL